MDRQTMLNLEPELERITNAAAIEASAGRNPWRAYNAAVTAATALVGGSARSDRLKSGAAYECFIKYLVDRMGI